MASFTFNTSNDSQSSAYAYLLKNLVDDPDIGGQMPSDEEEDSGDPHMENNNHEEEDQPQPQQTQPEPESQPQKFNRLLRHFFSLSLIGSLKDLKSLVFHGLEGPFWPLWVFGISFTGGFKSLPLQLGSYPEEWSADPSHL